MRIFLIAVLLGLMAAPMADARPRRPAFRGFGWGRMAVPRPGPGCIDTGRR